VLPCSIITRATALSHFSLLHCSIISRCCSVQSFSIATVLDHSLCYIAQSFLVSCSAQPFLNATTRGAGAARSVKCAGGGHDSVKAAWGHVGTKGARLAWSGRAWLDWWLDFWVHVMDPWFITQANEWTLFITGGDRSIGSSPGPNGPVTPEPANRSTCTHYSDSVIFEISSAIFCDFIRHSWDFIMHTLNHFLISSDILEISSTIYLFHQTFLIFH
jgi:hypothetical protein